MGKSIGWLLNSVGFAIVLVLLMGCSPADTKTNYTLTEMHAFPYYTKTGVVRRDLNLFDGGYLLWNVIIGGDCGAECLPEIPGSTTITMIDVRVNADKEPDWASHATVELKVRAAANKRVVKTERIQLNSILAAEARTWVIPFVLYNTGCEELEVSAIVVGGQRALGKPLTKTIPFKCGE